MDSVDDSIIATPTDTSNLSTPESSSSEVSQPTVKLRANFMKVPLKKRDAQQDMFRKQKLSIDNHQPFLQTLDQDGRRLVETTGRTAQRARARFDEKSRDTGQPKKTNENYRSNRSYQPRKCHSTTSLVSQDKNTNRRIKHRHNSYGMEPSRRSWETPEISTKYSAGDYLRQQILEDLSSNELIGKTEEQIAEDRCNRVKAYLRRRNVDSPCIPPKDKLRELKYRWQSEGRLGTNDSISVSSHNATRRNDLDRIRSYLQDKIRTMMEEDERWSRVKEKSLVEYPRELSMQDIRRRYSDYRRVKDRGYPTRRVLSDINVRGEKNVSSSGWKRDEKNLAKIEFPSAAKSGRRRENFCRRTRSYVIPETVIDPEDIEIRKRFYSYSESHRKLWQTKSCLTFEKKLSLPSKASMNLDRESEHSSPTDCRNDRECDENNETNIEDSYGKNNKQHCRRTRSDTLPEKITSSGCRAKRRSVSWSDKRKLHRRISGRLAALADDTSLDSDVNYTTNARRTKTQQGNLCSWREYKEKRRQERLLRESINGAAADEDDQKICAIPKAWKNFREYPTNCDKLGADTKIKQISPCERNDQQESSERSYITKDPKTMTSKLVTSTNENSKENTRNVGDTNDDTETETIIQENYLLLEKSKLETNKLWSPTISKIQVNEYGDPEVPFNNEFNTVDFGYDTIPRRRDNADNSSRCDRIDYNTNSRVKKTDTFKIIDGSKDDLDYEYQKMCNFNETCRRLNDKKSSLDERVVTDSNDVYTNMEQNCIANYDSEVSASHPTPDDDSISLSNKDMARNYFKRVYELLKQRQENAKQKSVGVLAPVKYDEDTSSSNYAEREEEVRRRRPRRKKDKPHQGEEIVTVPPGVDAKDSWTVQKLLVNNDPGGNLIFRRPQLQNVTGQKRPRQPAPPIPANCKINVKDISKYFDYPNKENSSPSNGVISNNKCQLERNDPKERQRVEENENEMGSNLSRHSGKGLTGRRTQSSGNLCDPKGKLNHVGKILVPCSSSQRERYKIRGSLPNHLDDKEILDDEDPRENNNVISDTMAGNLGGTLPHKKRALGVHFSDTGPTGTLDLVKHRSQESLEGDPWRYQDGVDLDLVRCKHGNFDLVRKNQSADAVDGDGSSRRYGTLGRTSGTKCHRSTDLDLVGVLPKKKSNESKGAVLRQNFEARQNRSVERIGGEVTMKLTHRPDCELMKHRQLDRAVDLKLSRLIGGEPQDQGYASERSPEDEHPPSLPGQDFPNVTPESTFCVTLQKSSRGLGLSVSGGGVAGPVRVKRLFPQQPAALSNKLQPGDILLAANGVPLTGLTNYEALEVLRTTPSTVELVVCRLPGDTSITPPGAPPPPPARREPPPPPPLRILNPLPPLQIEPCGEFDIEMTKVAGSLGFTLRKVDSSALGHYVRALVREPALSDGRIRPGDKIVAVDGATLSPMSHEEAVALLRQCGPRVKLRLYRDLAQTPVSALSPTEPDHPLRPPRTSLRQEAVDMLCDLAVRKLSPGTSNGSNSMQASGATSNSPRRLRRPNSRTPTAENENENHLTFHPVNPSMLIHTDGSETDQCSINTQPTTNSQSGTPSNDIIDPPPLYDVCDWSDSSRFAPRPSFLNLGSSTEKPNFKFGHESDLEHGGLTILSESDSNLTGELSYEDNIVKNSMTLSSDEQDNNLPSEPASMPPLLTTTRTTSGIFSYKNPAYQSANPTCGGIDNSAKNKAAHSSDQDIPGKVLGTEDPVGSKGLLKWKGVMFAPNDGDDEATRGNAATENTGRDCIAESTSRENICEDGSEVFMVELTRGWNSRLGFSLQPEGNSTVISVVHPDSVAAKDGRLKQGDILIMVNDESVESMPTAEIIDLLRKIRGSIGIMVMRKNRMKNPS